MTPAYRALLDRLRSFTALNKAEGLLSWDHAVMMPPGGGSSRAEACAAVGSAMHALIAGEDFGRLLDAAEADNPRGPVEAAMIRWSRREFERRRRVPPALVEELARHASLSHGIWVEARAKSDFAAFRPALEKMFELKRRQAEALAPSGDLYDAWLQEFEPGMTTGEAAGLLEAIRAGLAPLAKSVLARGPKAPVLSGRFPIDAQKRLGELAVREMGFDLSRGRLDTAAHPFCCFLGRGDVRLTTRYFEDLPFSSLYSCLHEAGHGLYEQGVAPELDGTPLGTGATMAMHESQSRLWENVVGRSRGFWKRWTPRFHEAFPQTRALGPENFYRAVNRVSASCIRVEADELTYGLHVILRFELERDLLAGRLRAGDLPEAWNAKMKAHLGIVPPDDARGVLQDVHWAEGLIGYFPTYVIGNAISLQLWEAALKARPGIEAEIEDGGAPSLLSWLVENVHSRGKTGTAQEIVAAATGGPIDPAAYLRYMTQKYGEL
ncbi:MAG: carboxypeptidase M32 [Elusimicrobia bacterium]|nr:carboxypeptidase M32 [Elusimicrobiota bacterium]